MKSTISMMAASAMASLGSAFSMDRDPGRHEVKRTSRNRHKLSPTKKYANGIKKIHATNKRPVRGACQLREMAVGKHWLKA